MFNIFCFSAFYDVLSLWIFLAACVLCVKSSTNLCLAGPHAKLVQTLIDSVVFLSKCLLLSVMNVFISGPALTST